MSVEIFPPPYKEAVLLLAVSIKVCVFFFVTFLVPFNLSEISLSGVAYYLKGVDTIWRHPCVSIFALLWRMKATFLLW